MNAVALPNEWTRGRLAGALRALLQRVLLWPATSWVCRPARVVGVENLQGYGPFVFIANHSSHADTALLLKSLPRRIRKRTAPAAAEDYFFSSRARGIVVGLLTGAFPFPRCGRAGLDRASALLAHGWSVILFPEGTRSRDGRVHEFKRGVGVLAAEGAVIVPVGVAGTGDVLGPGEGVPRRAPVAVAIGAPIHAAEGAARTVDELRDRVVELAAHAQASLAPPRPNLHERVRAFASSSNARRLCFAWGVAEALFFPIVPDFAVAPLALAAPGSFVSLALCAAAGSLAGGAIAYELGAGSAGAALASHLPLVTPHMSSAAFDWLSSGAAGLLRQPFSGIPYKVFAYQAHGAGVGFAPFLWFSALARGGRLIAVSAGFALVGRAGRRWWPRIFGVFLCLYVSCFAIGLARVVGGWS